MNEAKGPCLPHASQKGLQSLKEARAVLFHGKTHIFPVCSFSPTQARVPVLQSTVFEEGCTFEMYETLAGVYDEFMQEIPASAWADYAQALWHRFGLRPHLVLDLACGTGSLAIELTRRGYDLTALDASAEMLTAAREKAEQAGLSEKILFLMQDMTAFELYGTVDSIVCTCDSLNYLPDEEALFKVFQLAENYLDQGGLFLFDLNTEHKFKDVLSGTSFGDVAGDAAYVCQNYYYEEEKVHEYQVTFFEKKGNGLYERKEETHLEKAFDIGRVEDLLEKAHFKVEGVFNALTFDPYTAASERVCFAARETRPKKTLESA